MNLNEAKEILKKNGYNIDEGLSEHAKLCYRAKKDGIVSKSGAYIVAALVLKAGENYDTALSLVKTVQDGGRALEVE